MVKDVVILAGGSGTRLWPLSRGGLQKQFLPLPGRKPLIVQAYERARALASPDRIWVVTNKKQVRQTQKALPGLPRKNILAEPQVKNTAPALVLAALALQARYGSPRTMLVLPADHHVPDVKDFLRQVKPGLEEAERGRSLVTFGLKIREPSSEFGYIQAQSGKTRGACRLVKRFIEKPPKKQAQAFARSKSYFWNSGMFAWRTDFFLKELELMDAKLSKSFAPLFQGPLGKRALEALYRKIQPISIDYALMEKSKNVRVCPVSFQWSDLGTWPSVYQALKPSKKNQIQGGGQVYAGKGNLVRAGKKPVILFGLSETVYIETEEAILLTDFEGARRLRELHSQLPSKLK